MFWASCLLAFVSLCAAHALPSSSTNYSMLFQFGDSLSDTGNAAASFVDAPGIRELTRPPFGMTYFGYPTGRNCDGRLVLDFLALRLGFPLVEPYMAPKNGNLSFSRGVNFATCEATAVSSRFYSKNLGTWDLPSQTRIFLDFQKKHPLADFSNALYMIGEIGGNDYWFMSKSGLTFPQMLQLVPQVVESVVHQIRRLYKAGARMFVVLNTANQGCMPPKHSRKEECNNINVIHNKLLESKIQKLRAELKDSTISYADFYSAHAELVKDHKAFGIRDPHSICCGHYTNYLETTLFCGQVKTVNGKVKIGEACSDPEHYIYWNGGHFTDHANSIMAAKILGQPPLTRLYRSE